MRAFSILLLLCSIIACEENTRVNLISGRLLQDCSNPLADVELALKSNIGGDFQNAFILGIGMSTTDGSFMLNYELDEEDIGTADLLLILKDSFEVLIQDLEINRDIDLTLHRNNYSLLLINISSNRQLTANDTLYIDGDGFTEPIIVIQPPDTLIQEIRIPNKIEGVSSASLHYGLGKREFQLAKEALTIPDSIFQLEPFIIKRCGDTTLAKIEVN